MPNRIYAVLASATLAVMLTACGTPETKDVASASTRLESSWCLGDRPISYVPADAAGQDDPANKFDTDATVAEIMAHNARYRAACPDPAE